MNNHLLFPILFLLSYHMSANSFVGSRKVNSLDELSDITIKIGFNREVNENEHQKTSLGANGLDGLPAMTEAVGPEGEEESKRLYGLTGMPGQKGEMGLVGPPGYKGERGWQGQKGNKGDDGYFGPPGPKGEKGEPGLQAYESEIRRICLEVINAQKSETTTSYYG